MSCWSRSVLNDTLLLMSVLLASFEPLAGTLSAVVNSPPLIGFRNPSVEKDAKQHSWVLEEDNSSPLFDQEWLTNYRDEYYEYDEHEEHDSEGGEYVEVAHSDKLSQYAYTTVNDNLEDLLPLLSSPQPIVILVSAEEGLSPAAITISHDGRVRWNQERHRGWMVDVLKQILLSCEKSVQPSVTSTDGTTVVAQDYENCCVLPSSVKKRVDASVEKAYAKVFDYAHVSDEDDLTSSLLYPEWLR